MGLTDTLRRLTRDPRIFITVGKVVDIDTSKLTMTVAPSDGGAELHDVRLTAVIDGSISGLVQYPAIDSSVVVGCVDGDDTNPVLLLASEVDKVVVTIGGLALEINENGIALGKSGTATYKAVKGETLQQQLNALKQRVDAIYQALLSSPVAPGDGGATFKAAISAAISASPVADFGQILSNKITIE